MVTLRLKRIAAGFTQSDLARRVIRTQSWLSDVEKGKITPSFADAVVISRYLSTDVKDLFPTWTSADESFDENAADSIGKCTAPHCPDHWMRSLPRKGHFLWISFWAT